MKRKLVINSTGVFLLLCTILFSGCKRNFIQKESVPEPKIKLVPESFAKTIVEKFNASYFLKRGASLNQNSRTNAKTENKLNGNNQIESEFEYKDKEGNPALYVFNFANNDGFVIVSADFDVEPILAFVDHGVFLQNVNLPWGLKNWINKTTENIEVVREGLYNNDTSALSAWGNYINTYNVPVPDSSRAPGGCPPTPPNKVYAYVFPLIPVTWGQECTYNDSCDLSQNFPCSLCGDGRPVTGCVATAMAQLIRYWQFPTNAYNYASMPIASGNVAVEELMRDAGNSVDMQYGCDGSYAYGDAVPGALMNTFHYSSADRVSYSSSDLGDENVLITNLEDNEPVLLEGVDPNAGGHEWICDGVDNAVEYYCDDNHVISDIYNMLHMNWGWHEVFGGTDYNGWYVYDDWEIQGAGPNGSNINFQYANYAIMNIHP